MIGNVSGMEIYKLPNKHNPINSGIISFLKTNAREDFVKKFQYASDKLLEIFTDYKKIMRAINLKKLKLIIEERTEVLKKDKLEYLKNTSFSEIQIPIKFYTKNKYSGLNLIKKDIYDRIQEFITDKQDELEKSFWYIPTRHHTNQPTVVFVPLLGATPTNVKSEEDLSLLMTGINFDLRANPMVRGIDVSENVKLLFDYFTKCNYLNNNPTQKVFACQKYLSKNQNHTMTSQLLSVHLQLPSHLNRNKWATLLVIDLLINADYKYVSKLIDKKTPKPFDVFYRFFRSQIALPTQWNNLIKNFTSKVLAKYVELNSSATNLTLEHLSSQKLAVYHIDPILKKFETVNEDVNKEQHNKIGNRFFKKFVRTMLIPERCVTNSHPIIFRTLDFLSLPEVLEFRKSMSVPRYNKK